MGAEEKNMNGILSRVVADLFVKSKEGEELSSKIHRLRDEIKKVIEIENTIFGKFRELVESFREIIPDENQRYNAAIKALSTTSKLSRQEIVKAVNNQLEELKILEKGLMPALPAWRDELKVMEVKSREMRDEISKLREKIERLESEEKEILDDMAAREKDMELVEKAVGKLFSDIGAEIANSRKKVEEFTAESAASQQNPPGISSPRDIPGEGKRGGGQKSEILEPSGDSEWQKKCPMCGGRMDFYINEDRWQCYACGYEELNKDDVPANKRREK
jgi:DNA repair exonuclease SbcCD ATPase subunit/ribosomal protein S27AE